MSDQIPRYPKSGTLKFRPGRRPRGKTGEINQTMPRFCRDDALKYKAEEKRLRHWSWRATKSERAVQEAHDMMPAQLKDGCRVSKSGNDIVSFGGMVIEALEERAAHELAVKELRYLQARRRLHERQIGRINKRIAALGGLVRKPALTRQEELEEARRAAEMKDEVGSRRRRKANVRKSESGGEQDMRELKLDYEPGISLIPGPWKVKDESGKTVCSASRPNEAAQKAVEIYGPASVTYTERAESKMREMVGA